MEDYSYRRPPPKSLYLNNKMERRGKKKTNMKEESVQLLVTPSQITPNSFRSALCGFLMTRGLGERAHSRTHPFFISTYRAKKGQWVVGETQSARGIVR